MHHARVTFLAAPRGYGKSQLIGDYLRDFPQTHVQISCTPDDRLAPHLADRLTRTMTRQLNTDVFNSIYSDYASISRAESSHGLARLIARDLERWSEPLLLVVNGLASEEAVVFASELAHLSSERFRFVLAGYPFIANHAYPRDYVLQAEHMQYTLQELAELGVRPEDAEELRHWPAIIDLFKRSGQSDIERYCLQLVRQMEASEPELLAASLLLGWGHGREQQRELTALGLPHDYLQRIEAYGWPLEALGEQIHPHPLIREAMLGRLKRRSELEDRLADVIQDTQPVRAMELRSQSGDTKGVLAVAREYLPAWFRQGQWGQIIASLEPYYRLLTTEERTMLARAVLETASEKSALRKALEIAALALQDGGDRQKLGVIQTELLLRLGRLGAARSGLDRLLEGGQAEPSLIAWQALLHLQSMEPQRAIYLLSEEAQARHTILGQVVYAQALLQTGQPERGNDIVSQVYHHYYLEPTVTAMLQNVRGAFALIQALSDCSLHTQAQQLLNLLPLRENGYWFDANVQHLSGLLAWRQFDEDEALRRLDQAAVLARSAQDDELLSRILQTMFLTLVYFRRYSRAEDVRIQLIHIAASETYLEAWISEAGAALQLIRGERPATSRATSLREVGLLLRRVAGDSRTEMFPEGQRLLWENWQPLPEGLGSLSEADRADHVLLRPPSMRTDHHFRLRLLGGLRAELDGQPIELSDRHLLLLSALALGPQDATELAGALYAGRNPSGTLRTAVSRLRDRLQATGVSGSDTVITRAQGGQYRLADGWTAEVDAQTLLQGNPADLPDLYAPLVCAVAVQRERLIVLTPETFDREVIRMLERYPNRQQALLWLAALNREYPQRFTPLRGPADQTAG
ncbi:hypothetical protein [Deinococcus proteolyticus]|nr:hypothetical protein [Deinococcus proteolyticus]